MNTLPLSIVRKLKLLYTLPQYLNDNVFEIIHELKDWNIRRIELGMSGITVVLHGEMVENWLSSWTFENSRMKELGYDPIAMLDTIFREIFKTPTMIPLGDRRTLIVKTHSVGDASFDILEYDGMYFNLIQTELVSHITEGISEYINNG